ncbi:NYN domain-containing protein [Pelomonas sp. KK5]|uniref:NYN domain-containing protein n=1 Tax=Pelomonas sp. KK5 TaxID=1855730 RepID=UPI00097C9543|nr:NYN domain-containing protein [Pelomonas sp. KK5]
MARPRRVMLLVDFDNCSPEVIAQAFEIAFKDYGAIHVRRAYCTAEQAQHNAGFLKRLSLRPMVNLSVGKNSTDIALAVDAMDLVIAERPDVVAIVSSDSDFTPLVGRLREKGAWVRGFGQQGKTGEGVQAAYDQYDDIEHRAAKVAAKKAANRPAEKPTRKPVEKPVEKPAAKPVAKPAGKAPEPIAEVQAAKPARKRAPRGKKAAEALPVVEPVLVEPVAEAVALPAEVEAILQAVPVLRGGERVELGEAAQALRQAGLLGRTQASTRLFKKHAEHFVLSPELQPNKVQFWPDAGT